MYPEKKNLHKDTNCVLIDVFEDVLGVHYITRLLPSAFNSQPLTHSSFVAFTHLRLNRHKSRLNLKVSSKLLQSYLSFCTHNDVRSGVVDIFPSGFHLFLPSALESETAKHDGFRGTGSSGAHSRGFFGSVPEVREH